MKNHSFSLRHLKHQSGFTLVEIVISIVIFGVIGSVMTLMLGKGFDVTNASNDVQEMTSTQRYVNERIAKEIRAVKYDSVNGRYNMTLGGTVLTFTKTDGNVVTLTLSPPNISLGYSTPAVSSILADGVTAANFSYFGSDGVTVAASNVDVSFVELSMTLTRNTTPYVSTIRVALRDL